MSIDWDRLVIGPTVAIFGDQVRYSTRGRSFDITGVFDEQYLGMNPIAGGFTLGDPGAITTAMPVLGVQLSQFTEKGAEPAQGDVFEMRSGLHAGEVYEIKEVQPDGHGHALLLLNALMG
jgi:hypothetical protein